ncbi:MAG TPA: hypothetical protein DCQ04_02805 [Actinobacteria bacterium]|nr:hypothetical protein [Actinomycetota bacterium]
MNHDVQILAQDVADLKGTLRRYSGSRETRDPYHAQANPLRRQRGPLRKNFRSERPSADEAQALKGAPTANQGREALAHALLGPTGKALVARRGPDSRAPGSAELPLDGLR